MHCKRASKMTPPPPPWTFAWLSGEVARQQGQFAVAERNFRSVLEDRTEERANRQFDFSLDYVVRNQLGSTLVDLAELAEGRGIMIKPNSSCCRPKTSSTRSLPSIQRMLRLMRICAICIRGWPVLRSLKRAVISCSPKRSFMGKRTEIEVQAR